MTEPAATDPIVLPDVDGLAARIPDGASLAIFKPEEGAAAMAATRALIRRGVRNLHLITVPQAGLQADMLIGAGCVATVETSGVTLSEYGQAPCFQRAVTSGTVEVRDATCPAIYAALQAAEKGIPFMPLRGLIGSDILANRPDYKVIDNPFATDDPIVALPAMVPDVALFHAPLADRHGNVWVGRTAEFKIMAHAARQTLVTCEELYDGNLHDNAELGPATLDALYVSGVAVAERGARPHDMPGRYGADDAYLAEYAARAATAEGFDAWLAEHVLDAREAAE